VFFKAGILACALAATQFACQKKAVGPPPRYAILRFENLSGDLALDWMARAASEALSVSLSGVSVSGMDGPVLATQALNRLTATLGGRPVSAPGSSTERDKALLAGATRAITGYVEKIGGEVRITAVVEDLSNGKSLRTFMSAGASPIAALNQLAHEFSRSPLPFPTSNANALKAWSIALESPPARSAELLEEAVHLDPNFGAAWVSLAANDFARGDRTGAAAVIERAHRQNLDKFTQANLDLEAATLSNDRNLRISALRTLSALSPGDAVLLRTVAESETAAGQFKAAALAWQKVTTALPNDPTIWNSLGYARSYAGDYQGALTALHTYERLRPKDANPSDSIGDLNYSFRKYNEAAASYLQAHTKQPGFEQYGDLYKAAWAKFHGGDNAGADALIAQFRAARDKNEEGKDNQNKATMTPLLMADWLYRTGRKPEAIAALRKAAAESPAGALRSNSFAQLAIWDLLQGNRALAAKDATSIGASTSSASVLVARFAASPSAAPGEWQSRADRAIPPGMVPLRQLAVGYALLLDGKRDAALQVWGQIAETSSATDFFAHAIYARLQGKQLERPLLPDPVNFNPFAAVLDEL
jgi:tetratricopeptide (TPR) repeat protein